MNVECKIHMFACVDIKTMDVPPSSSSRKDSDYEVRVSSNTPVRVKAAQ